MNTIKKNNKVLIIFYVFLLISFIGITFYFNSTYDTTPLPDLMPKPIKEIEIITETKIEKNKIFLLMTDLKNYPKILLHNVKSVNILKQGNSTVIAEFDVIEKGISSKILTKQTIYPYSKHVIEVISGDAKGTKITQIFSEKNLITTIDTKIDLNLKGILSVFSYLPKGNLEHASNTVVSTFLNYAELFDNNTEKIIDDLYREILLRPADQEGLVYFSDLLKNEQISENEIRTLLLTSDENTTKIQSIDELSVETKNIVNDLYQKILLRDADTAGLKYFGSLLESGTTSDELRILFLESDEGKDTSIHHPVRSEIKFVYAELFDRAPDMSELNYYHKIIDDGLMTIEDIEIKLKNSEEFLNLKISEK